MEGGGDERKKRFIMLQEPEREVGKPAACGLAPWRGRVQAKVFCKAAESYKKDRLRQLDKIT